MSVLPEDVSSLNVFDLSPAQATSLISSGRLFIEHPAFRNDEGFNEWLHNDLPENDSDCPFMNTLFREDTLKEIPDEAKERAHEIRQSVAELVHFDGFYANTSASGAFRLVKKLLQDSDFDVSHLKCSVEQWRNYDREEFRWTALGCAAAGLHVSSDTERRDSAALLRAILEFLGYMLAGPISPVLREFYHAGPERCKEMLYTLDDEDLVRQSKAYIGVSTAWLQRLPDGSLFSTASTSIGPHGGATFLLRSSWPLRSLPCLWWVQFRFPRRCRRSASP